MWSGSIECCSSAPGKAILFGEHAVVYGAAAVAAALADLRIHVNVSLRCNDDDDTDAPSCIEVILHDIPSEDGSDKPFRERVSAAQLRKLNIGSMGDAAAVDQPIKPDDDTLLKLRNEFESYSLPCSQGLMSASYLVSKILPELIYGSEGDGFGNLVSVFGNSSNNSSKCLKVDVQSKGLPIGAGLGSSAAFSVALSGALIRMRDVIFSDRRLQEDKAITNTIPSSAKLSTINGWAYAAEVVIHGSPSGLDNTTSCYGGAIKYSKDQGTFQNLSNLPPMQILLTNTKVPRSTKQLVANVRKLYDDYPAIITHILSGIEGISLKFLELVDKVQSGQITNPEFVSETGKLFNLNHHLLCALGVGHESLTSVHETSMSFHCPCKLTGAGGGGCALTLLQPSDNNMSLILELTKKLESLEYSVFSSTIGGDGVRWHDMYSI